MPIQKDGSIVISAQDVAKGISPSPHLGIAHIRNLDIWSKPGVVMIQDRLEATSVDLDSLISTSAIGSCFARDPSSGDMFMGVDGAGSGNCVIYKNPQSGTTVYKNGLDPIKDMIVWQGYLIVIYTSSVSSYKLADGTIQAIAGTLTTGNHKIIQPDADTDALYITDGDGIATITGTAPTFTLTNDVKVLPSGVTTRTLAASGKILPVGTMKGANAYDNAFANLYLVDLGDTRSQPYDSIQLNDYGVHQLINEDKTIYGQIGILNRFFVSNLAFTKDLPEFYMMDNLGPSNWLLNYPNACGLLNGEKLFGLSNGGGSPTPLGVYAYKNGAWVLRNTISTGSVGDSSTVRIYAIIPLSQKSYLVSWGDGNSKGVDVISSSNYKYDSYLAYFESMLYPVGSSFNKTQYSQIELQLGKPLVTGQSVRLSYREKLTDSFTTIITLDTTNTESGDTHHLITEAGLPDAKTLQFKVSLSQTTATASGENVEFKALRIF